MMENLRLSLDLIEQIKELLGALDYETYHIIKDDLDSVESKIKRALRQREKDAMCELIAASVTPRSEWPGEG